MDIEWKERTREINAQKEKTIKNDWMNIIMIIN